MKKEFIKRYGWTLLGIVAGTGGLLLSSFMPERKETKKEE